MKRKLVIFLLACALLLGAIPAYAAQASFTVRVQADRQNAKIGDTIYFTVVAEGEDVVALQFNLDIPSGLEYVSGSAATPKGLHEKLGVAAADWTEGSMIFTYYNDVGVTIPKGTVLLTFACKAKAVGSHQAGLVEVLPFNSEFQEFTPSVQLDTVTVSKAEEQGGNEQASSNPTEDTTTTEPTTEDPSTEPTQDTPDTQPTEPSDPGETTLPDQTQPTNPDDESATEDTDPDASQGTGDPIEGESTNPTQEDHEATEPSDTAGSQQGEGEETDLTVLWIVLGAAVLAAAVFVAFRLVKRKGN